jgi:LPXTG-site transpeptidase (sortase) family protein
MKEKIFFKYFIIFFILGFLIFNWGKISFLFSPKVIWDFLSLKVEEKKEKEKNEFSVEFLGKVKTEETSSQTIIFENKIEIPNIEVSAPIVLAKNEKEVANQLKKGVVLFPGSAFPGEKGATIILGHSAPLHWPKIMYDWVFTKLQYLQEGDEIFVYFNGKKYKYKVKEKIILKKGQEIPWEDDSENSLVLISCWPPGKDIKRMAVKAMLDKDEKIW